MKPAVPILCLLVLPFIPTGCVRPQGPSYFPMFSLDPGVQYNYRLSETNEVLADERGDRVWLHRNEYLDLRCAQDLPAGPVRVTCDTFALHQQSPALEINLDSGSAPESTDPHSRMFGAYSGADWTCRVDAQGRVSGMRGFDRVFRRMGRLGGGADGSDWETKFDARYFAGLLSQGWHLEPGRRVAEGDSWTQVDSLVADAGVPVPTTYTLVRARDGILYVQTSADVDVAGYRPEGLSHPGTFSLTGTQRGYLTLDAVTGRLLSRTATLSARGRLRSAAGDEPIFLHSVYTLNFVHS